MSDFFRNTIFVSFDHKNRIGRVIDEFKSMLFVCDTFAFRLHVSTVFIGTSIARSLSKLKLYGKNNEGGHAGRIDF